MKLSDLQPNSYELLRVVRPHETLCDIRLEKMHRHDGTPRWRIVDVAGHDELSSAGRWYPIGRAINWNHYRFESAEAALAVWNRGVELPSITERLKDKDGQVIEHFADSYEEIRCGCEREEAPHD